MKKIILLPFIITSLLITSCNSSQPEQDVPGQKEEEKEEPVDTALIEAKQNGISEIENYVALSNYYEDEQQKILSYIEKCRNKINDCIKIEEINTYLAMYKSFIDSVKTKEDIDAEEIPAEPEKPSIDDFDGTAQISKYKELGYEPVFRDPNYKKGYGVTKTSYGPGESPYHTGYLKPYPQFKQTPDWRFAQWHSKYDIFGNDSNGGYEETTDETGLIHTYTSKGKVVNNKFVPAKMVTANSMTGEVYFESNCSVEYDEPRTGSEPWVHLLYEQDFSSHLIKVSDCESIVMEAEFVVDKCINKTGSSYNTSRHAAQLVWYLTLQNRKGDHSINPDFGKYIWFGLNLFDNRFAGQKVDLYRAHDEASDTLIYSPGTESFYEDGLCPKIGVEARAHVDIVSVIKEAFKYAKDNGYLGNTKYEDLYIGGTNFGYEVPGVFDIASTIHAINVFVK